MLTRESYPKFPKRDVVLDGGHHKPGLSFGPMEFPESDMLGEHLEERRFGLETCTVALELGELIEAYVSDSEVGICFDNTVMAIYDRVTGALNCASYSLVQGVLDASRFNIKMNRVTVRKAKELSRAGGDIVVIVNFDEDGEERISLVMTEGGEVTRVLAAARVDDMGHDYGFPEEKDELDFIVEGEEEEVGELLRAWRCVCPVGGIDFGVGVRVFLLDFVVINPRTQEAVPCHVAEQLEFAIFDSEKINPKLVLLLAERAFPGMDWV